MKIVKYLGVVGFVSLFGVALWLDYGKATELYPNIKNDWIIEYNPTTGKYRAIDKRFKLEWFSQYKNKNALIRRINEQHDYEVEKNQTSTNWQVVQ